MEQTETVRLPKEVSTHGHNEDSMGGSHHKSTALSHQGSEDAMHHLDHLQPNLPAHVLNRIRYKGTTLSRTDIQRISDILIQKCKDNLDIPLYICSTPKGVFKFNLYLVDPKWEIQYHNKTTEFSNTNKIAKEIAMLPVINAEIL